ncbi:hypothetical protein [Winogradskyella sp.]|uniref:hypothetical protein n=1 Tax=Winogradskyella sp. TaxID=1883156 RepID=UPI0025CE87BE|nr:hypothetical protein [Winogradskyella sp.]
MTIFTNKKHFLHQHLTFIESTGKDGKDSKFNKFLTDLGVSNNGNCWDIDHSTIDWNKTGNHYQFFFDYVDNESEITDWLGKSDLSKYEFLYTWLDWNDPIVKIKTVDFINSWGEFYMASVEGMILTTIDGAKYMEFTDDWKFHLNSNFEIKPNSLK